VHGKFDSFDFVHVIQDPPGECEQSCAEQCTLPSHSSETATQFRFLRMPSTLQPLFINVKKDQGITCFNVLCGWWEISQCFYSSSLQADN
jgi:hypothetical protein